MTYGRTTKTWTVRAGILRSWSSIKDTLGIIRLTKLFDMGLPLVIILINKPGQIYLGVPSYSIWKYNKKMDGSNWEAVLRDSLKGHFSASQNWTDLPRTKLVQFSLSHP